MKEETFSDLATLGPEFDELLRERTELLQAIDFWRASEAVGAADRVAEFERLLAELEDEIQLLRESQQTVN